MLSLMDSKLPIDVYKIMCIHDIEEEVKLSRGMNGSKRRAVWEIQCCGLDMVKVYYVLVWKYLYVIYLVHEIMLIKNTA